MTIDIATAKASAWQQGCQDYLAGVHTNPFHHEADPIRHRDWWCGYSHAEQTYAETQHLEASA